MACTDDRILQYIDLTAPKVAALQVKTERIFSPITANQDLEHSEIPPSLELAPPPLLCLPLCGRRSLQDALEGGHGGVGAERPPHDARARPGALGRRRRLVEFSKKLVIKSIIILKKN